MAKISLRAYNREIDSQIDRGQIEEAIAHCKYILKQLPKHIDTYRLLGKAFLEGKRYTDAADILQRVLSTCPDDFISQCGLSIIREDEGNLDAAISHMERAFEVQPANSAVQDELRRLYGRRDGSEPPKIRLTRGALVRMYMRGELYPQAVAEARAALAEDPQRVDLEVVLARLFFLQNRQVEATEICSRLLTKLPYCYEANRILAEILPNTSRAEDAKTYRQNVIALDPYAAYVSAEAPTPERVPENAVSLERLDYAAEAAGYKEPDWAKAVGIDIQNTDENLPDWLRSITSIGQASSQSQATEPQDVVAPTPQPEETTITPEDSDQEIPGAIPDWMQSAGWVENANPSIEAQMGEMPEETDTSPVEESDDFIASAEIPDWLQNLAPIDDTSPTRVDSQSLSGSSNGIDEEADSSGELAGNEPLSDLENEFIDDNKVFPFESSNVVPSWMSTDEPAEEDSSTETPTPETTPVSSNLPDWLRALQETPAEEETQADFSGDLPDWLSEIASEESGSAVASSDEITPSSEWFADSNSPEEEPGEPETAPVTAQEDSSAPEIGRAHV
jgi:tetratricopeptide (TPR) repeat protein